jgi:transcriptional regulator with XRE-family HTH domain
MSIEPGSDPLEPAGPRPIGEVIAIQRRRAGLTGSEVAARTGMSQSKISRIETGRSTATRDELGKLASAIGLSAEAGERLLRHAFQEGAAPGVPPARPDDLATRQREIAHTESSAKSMRVFTSQIVAGLLQTSEYARSTLSDFYQLLAADGTGSHEATVLESVAKRLDRQRILADPERQFHFVMQESVLSNAICPPAQMLTQLQRIREVAKQHDNVTVAFLTADVAPPPGSPTFTVYDDEYVILDLPHVPEVLAGTVNVSLYRRLFDRIEEDSTTDIDPILDKYIDMYYDLARPRRD